MGSLHVYRINVPGVSKIFCRSLAIGFDRWEKLFELNFFMRKTSCRCLIKVRKITLTAG